ncbi:hypothetical protein [Gorillibacterium sp. sgz5001074]|uniref:hypothetical protein n=1 Tax=Gorillibacterium sp. sgz5001074 TaxID=3446695 RepID=UPI003F6708E4
MQSKEAMNSRTKRIWARWILTVIAAGLLVVLSFVGYLYYQISSIQLEDIEQRVEQQGNAVQDGGQATSLPLILEKTVEVANGFSSKPIDSQDALDVAAILLKSGLSPKDVYFLMGKSTEKLSNKEKLEIRNKLLAKLSPEEIKALRSITSDYGKTLVILDKDYPIELVGVYDETERARIMKDLEARKQPLQPTVAAMPTPAASSAPAPEVKKSEDPMTPTKAADPSAGPGSLQLEEKYSGLLGKLQNSCSAQANRLVSEIAATLKSNKENGKELKLSELESIYMQKVMQAEKGCDTEFAKLTNQAEQEYSQAGYPADALEKWKAAYEQAKESARNQAILTLTAAVSGGG